MAASATLPGGANLSSRSDRKTGAVALLIFAIWLSTLFEPHWFVSSLVGMKAIMNRTPTVLLLALVLVSFRAGRSQVIYWPLAIFCLLHLLGILIADNRGMAIAGLKQVTRWFLLFTCTATLLSDPRHLLTLLKLFLLSFLWYGVQGLPGGVVGWHTELANKDGFGSLMVMAIGFGYNFGLAAKPKLWRYLGFGIAILGVIGVVASLARGAALGAALVMFVVWLRTPRKIATFLGGIAAAGILAMATQWLYPEGEFWAEMETIYTEGGSDGTGRGRLVLWTIGTKVWSTSPILGVGAYNAGVVGSQITPAGLYADTRFANPSKLYNRAFHNSYVQLLAEQGLVGFGLWIGMVWAFMRRLRDIRRPAAVEKWNAATGGIFDLRLLSLALEVAMVGYLAGAFFYNLTYRHWFYTLIAMAFMLEATTRPDPGNPAGVQGRGETLKEGTPGATVRAHS